MMKSHILQEVALLHILTEYSGLESKGPKSPNIILQGILYLT
jgi:hypothetical protein